MVGCEFLVGRRIRVRPRSGRSGCAELTTGYTPMAMPTARKTAALLFAGGVAYLLASYAVVLRLDRDTVRSLAGEDSVVEYLGAICFLLAAVFFLLTFWRTRSGNDLFFFRTRWNVFLLLLGLLFLLGFGEEISWGQRLLRIETPETLRIHNRQQEINLHNLDVFYLNVESLFSLFWLSYGIVVPLLNRFSRRASFFFTRVNLPVIPLGIGLLFAVNYLIFKGAALQTTGGRVHYLVELKECHLALLFALASIAICRRAG